MDDQSNQYNVEFDLASGSMKKIQLTPDEIAAANIQPNLTAEEFEHALDAYLDSVARIHRWDSRFTFVARAAYPNAWREQAIAFGEWMDGCNLQAYQLLADVTAGTKPAPKSIDDFISMFPKFSIG